MFLLLPNSAAKRRFAFAVSTVLHIALLLLLAYRTAPRYLVPNEIALGTQYSSGSVIYLAPLGPEQPHSAEVARFIKHQSLAKPSHESADRQHEEPDRVREMAPDITAHGGSAYGVHVPGSPLTGPAVIPALPQVFPDPPVFAKDVPPGVQGDVIVEVTIDENGNVTELKLTQGIGYGIDEKVLAILRQWHFRPAMRAGVTIASQHLVHFHYPS